MPGMTLFNTSPIQYLHQLGLLETLHTLYGKIYLPEEVVQEIEAGKKEGVDLPDLNRLDFAKQIGSRFSKFSLIVRDLGNGETSVILHGLENPGSVVVLDDLLARKVAIELKLAVTGTAGVLIVAKDRGLISEVGPYLNQLQRLGFHLSPRHKASIIKKAAE